MIVDNLDCAGLLFGAIGAALWAQNGTWCKYAAIFNLASSIMWLTYSCFHGTNAFVFSNAMYVAVNAYACHKWLGTRARGAKLAAVALQAVPLQLACPPECCAHVPEAKIH